VRVQHTSKIDLGDPISMEDAIAMLTVVFVLFVVILVPLISIDRMRLEKEQRDAVWQVAFDRLNAMDAEDPRITAYKGEFDLYNPRGVHVSRIDSQRLIEYLSKSGELIVILHDLQKDTFSSFHMTAGGTSVVFSRGTLTWNERSGEWLYSGDITYDYTQQDSTSVYLDSVYHDRLDMAFRRPSLRESGIQND
jgi:hypothetical protein